MFVLMIAKKQQGIREKYLGDATEKKEEKLDEFWHVSLSMIRYLLTAKGDKLNLVFMLFLKY